MSQKKRKNTSESRQRTYAQRRKARKNVAKNSTIAVVITAVAIVGIFVGRWVVAIGNGYYEAFAEPSAATISATRNMKGLEPTDEEKAEMLPLQKQWDLFTSSRLRDEVTMNAEDGTLLHGYLYNEGSNVTVVAVPRFYVDGTADFLAAPYLNELTGCNVLLTDPRSTGGSEGQYFTFGITEQKDLADWLSWANETLGPQTFILYGEGTGANTILFAAANGVLPSGVAFAVAESPYADLRTMAEDAIWNWYSVPKSFLLAIEGKLARSGAGFVMNDIDVAAALENASPTLPVLFLESEKDKYIIPEWTDKVVESYTGPHESVIGGGSHGTVYAEQNQAIRDAISAMWQRYGK